MPQSESVQFKSAKLFKGYKPIMAIKFDTYNAANHKYYANKTVTLDGKNYVMMLKSLPTITRSLNLMGGMSSIGNVSVTIINQKKESDFIRTIGLGFIMGTALVALIFDDGTTPLWAERLELFTGKIDDLSNIDFNNLTFSIIDNDKAKNKIIGSLITDTYSNRILSESIGKTKSNIYGTLLSHCPILHGGTEATIPTNFSFSKIGYKKGILYSNTDTDFEYFIADHEMNELTTSDVWLRDKKLNRFIHVFSTHVTISNPDANGDCTVKLSLIGGVFEYYDYWFGKESGTGSTDWNNKENACNKDIDTYADITENAVDWADESMNLNFNDYDDSDVVDGNIKGGHGIFVKAHVITGAAGDITFTVNAQNMDTEDGTKIKQAGTLGATVATISDDVVVRVIQDNATNVEIKVYEVYKRIYLERTGFDLNRFELYVSCKGREYGTWINGRSTAETDPNTGLNYTVNHPDDDGSGNLIENPVGVIESVARDLIGLNLEHLVENDFATHLKWTTTGKVVINGNHAAFTFDAGSLNGTMTQTAANRAEVGINEVSYVLTYTVAVITAPDGDFALTITNAFADSAITLPFTAGTHHIKFTSNASASIADFVIDASETTSTEGEFTIDNMYLQLNDMELESFNIAADARSTYKFSFAITEQIDSRELLSKLAFECGCWLFWNYANRLEILAYDSSADFSMSGGATAISRDIFIHQPRIHALDFGNMTESNITFTADSNYQLTDDMTIEVLAYFTDFDDNQGIICCGTAGENEAQNYLYCIYFSAANAVGYVHEYGAGTNELITITLNASLSIATWYHISIVRYNNLVPKLVTVTVRNPITGATIATGTTSYVNAPTGGGDSILTIGNTETLVNPLNGKIKEIRMWSDIRTSVELINNCYKILIGNESNLVGYWRLDEGAGPTVYDITANNNNGTIANISKIHDILYVDNFTKYSGNPILEGDTGEWDSYGIRNNWILCDHHGHLIKEGDKYIMYYAGKDGAAGDTKMGRATSDDGISWTKYGNNPIHTGSLASIIKRGDGDYIALYTHTTGGMKKATSTDGINWDVGADWILTPGDFVNINQMSMEEATWINDKWYMVCEGKSAVTQWHIYMASSPDFDKWTVENGGNTIYTSIVGWDAFAQANPRLLEIAAGKYIILYNGEAGANAWDIGIIYSTSLTSGWTSWANNPILTRGAGGSWDDTRIESCIMLLDDINAFMLRLWYFGLPTTNSMQDGKIGYAVCYGNCVFSTGTTYPDLGYYAEHPIVKDSFDVKLLNTTQLVNDLTLNYYKNLQSGNYQKTKNNTDGSSITKYGTLTKTIPIEFIRDATTINALHADLLTRQKEKYYIANWRTWLNAANCLEGDVCNVRHPLLDKGMMSNANMLSAKWQILRIKPLLDSCEIEITAIILAIP